MKKSIKLFIAGLLLLPMISLNLGTFNTLVSAAPPPAEATCDPNVIDISTGAKCAQPDKTKDKLFGPGSIFVNITNAALFIIGALGVLMLIYGGIRYTISGGDSANITAAKNTILYAVVGIIVALLAYALVNFVITTL